MDQAETEVSRSREFSTLLVRCFMRYKNLVEFVYISPLGELLLLKQDLISGFFLAFALALLGLWKAM
jgi:hypothetical protein